MRTPAVPAPTVAATTAPPTDSEAAATIVGLKGQVNLYVDGRLSQLRLNGSIGVRARGAPWTTTKLVRGQFELVLHRQPSGEYTTADQALNVGPHPERVRFDIAAPRTNEVGPLLLYNLATNAPRRSAESIPFGATDAVVSVTEAPALELEVLESGTGVHLDPVCVVAVSSESGLIQPRSGPGKVRLAWFEPSPLTLTPGDPLSHSKSSVIAVSAPGYGSKEITVDFSYSHRRVVELSQGGSLVVRIDGEIPGGSELMLYSREGINEKHGARRGETRFDSLAPNTYYALVLFSEGRGAGTTRLASGQAEVRPDETAELNLTIASAKSVTRADLAGTLVLPASWGIRDKRINGKLMGQAKAVGSQSFVLRNNDLVPAAGRTDAYEFEKKGLEVGRYVLELTALGVRTVVELPPEGVRDVELIVAPPVNVTVVLRDADSGGDLAGEIDTVYWGAKLTDAAQGFVSKSVRRIPRTGKFHLTVPAGEISVQAGPLIFFTEPLNVFATEGLEIVLPVTGPITAKLELRDGDAIIPWPVHSTLSGQDASGNQIMTRYTSNGPPTIEAHQSGTYWIKIPSIDGYLPHEDVAVEMKPGPQQLVIVQLAPR